MRAFTLIFCLLFALSGHTEPLKKQLERLKTENKSLLEERDSLIKEIANPTMVDEEVFLIKNRLTEVSEELKFNAQEQSRIQGELDNTKPNEWDVFNDF